MRNLTRPQQYETSAGSCFDAGAEGLVLYTGAGDSVRLHVGVDGFFYINGAPFGVKGMPPALHASMHAVGGGDELTAAMIGAVAQALLTSVPVAGGVPVLGEDGMLNPAFIAGLIDPAAHAESHGAGGADAITPASIRAVADTDPRLADRRDPLDHAQQHAKGQPDALTPASIGAVALDDGRLADRRFPVEHSGTHHRHGPDPLSWEDVGSVNADMFTALERIPYGYPQLNGIGHIDVNLLPSGLPPGPHASTHGVEGADRINPVDIDAADRAHTHGNADITHLDAGKITSGVLDMARIPQGALERLVLVDDEAALLAMTVADIQNGDTAQCLDTGIMYRVVDEAKLGTWDAFREYSAGRAAAVPWSGVENKPADYRPEVHAKRHAAGGDDPLTPGSIGAPTLAALETVRTLANQGITNAESARVVAAAAAPKTTTINTTAPLQGGGDLSANRTLSILTATTARTGVVKLNNTVTSTSTTEAATAAVAKGLADRVAALEASAVMSSNVKSIVGTVLPDGVGYFEIATR